MNKIKPILVVADDFTGANDTVAQFAKLGLSCVTTLEIERVPELIAKYDVVAVDTESRAVDSKKAYDILYSLGVMIKELIANEEIIIYKKVDSTLRGNITSEIKALYDSVLPDLVIFAPAYPKQDRTTINGIHLVNGVPVDQTYFGRDPRAPVKSSYVPSYFEGFSESIYQHVTLDSLRKRELSKIILENNRRVLSFDIENDDDFTLIFDSILKLPHRRIIWVGSAGLAEHLAYVLPTISKIKKPILIAVGSVNDVSRRQISTFINSHPDVSLILINITNLIENFTVEYNRIHEHVSSALDENKDIILTTSYTPTQLEEGKLMATKLGLSMRDFGNVLADKFGELISSVIKDFGRESFGGILLTGGDIAMATIRHLGINCVEIKGEVEPGLPVLTSGDLYIVTKAGGFGKEGTLIRAVNVLKLLGGGE